MNVSTILLIALIISAAVVVYAVILFASLMKKEDGNEQMQKIAKAIQAGARAFLHAEYKWLAIFVILVFIAMLISKESFGLAKAVPFLLGALASAVAGYFGMFTATRAAVRTTQAARSSLSSALKVAFQSGSVMGLSVVGLGLMGITALLIYSLRGMESLGAEAQHDLLTVNLNNILAFSFGASSIALFARVGGGIYTKAADVGADLVGKVEAGIPEDDPRNPATIADNVGDNVGDVAGMGADLFESYVGAILATLVLGVALAAQKGGGEHELILSKSMALICYPIALAAIGSVASILGAFLVNAKNEKKLHSALFRGVAGSSLIVIVAMYFVTQKLAPTYTMMTGKVVTPMAIYYSMIIGLLLGVIIGKVTEYYTSEQHKPAQEIARQSQTGAATNIIHGLGVGMASTWLPILLLAFGIYACNHFAGIYGICIAAVGMLSTLGITLAVDAFGPVADNAGGMAEMAKLPKEVRVRTDALDATGNTTAAIGKGFAIGSAALTALALFSTYKFSAQVLISDFSMDLSEPGVIVGLLIGAMLPFLFSSMAMGAVGKAANNMVEEVRRQFREDPGIMKGTSDPDYERCVAISTKGALGQMVAPGLLAALSPLIIGLLFGANSVAGLLAGALGAGVMMALFMANSGGAWDNAKKFVELGNFGGKGSDTHKATVIGDTVGDPFKDTAGPSINILIKLMSIAAVLALPLFAKWHLFS